MISPSGFFGGLCPIPLEMGSSSSQPFLPLPLQYYTVIITLMKSELQLLARKLANSILVINGTMLGWHYYIL